MVPSNHKSHKSVLTVQKVYPCSNQQHIVAVGMIKSRIADVNFGVIGRLIYYVRYWIFTIIIDLNSSYKFQISIQEYLDQNFTLFATVYHVRLYTFIQFRIIVIILKWNFIFQIHRTLFTRNKIVYWYIISSY